MYENQIKVNFKSNKEPGTHCFRLNYSSSHKRTEYLNGKKHTVVPATMLIANEVFHGNQGGWYYPAGAIARSVQAWNNKPVTNSHPVNEDGAYVSASSTPAIFNKFAVGTIFNTSFVNNKLTADLWLDNSKCQEIFALMNAEKDIEVSTGMFSDDILNVSGGSVLGSISEIFPDHLALLPNSVGACSVNHGCGIRANAAKPNHNYGEVLPMEDPTYYPDSLDDDSPNQNNDEVQPMSDPTYYEN